jgi:hypothetical protein
MNKSYSENSSIRILQKVQSQLKQIEDMGSVQEIKKEIHELLGFIEQESMENKAVLEEMIHIKIKETSGVNPEVNTYLYLLYRNLIQDKVSINEAQKLYKMYVKEYDI